MNEASKSPSDGIRAGDKVMHRESGKRGTVIEVLTRGAGLLGGEPQSYPTAWVKWEGETKRTAVPVADLIKMMADDGE